MQYLILIFSSYILVLAIIGVLYQRKKKSKTLKILGVLVAIIGILSFAFWFFKSSTNSLVQDQVSIQLINKVPQTLDFYTIKLNKTHYTEYETHHLGEIRPDYFRMDFLDVDKASEFWIVGYLGKNLVFFNQNFATNKNLDQIIKIEDYRIENLKNSEIANREILVQNSNFRNLGILSVFNFLLLSILIVLLLKKIN